MHWSDNAAYDNVTSEAYSLKADNPTSRYVDQRGNEVTINDLRDPSLSEWEKA